MATSKTKVYHITILAFSVCKVFFFSAAKNSFVSKFYCYLRYPESIILLDRFSSIRFFNFLSFFSSISFSIAIMSPFNLFDDSLSNCQDRKSMILSYFVLSNRILLLLSLSYYYLFKFFANSLQDLFVFFDDFSRSEPSPPRRLKLS